MTCDRNHLTEEKQDLLDNDIDVTSLDWNAGFEAGLRAADIVESEEVDNQVTPWQVDPETLSEDELVFYNVGFEAGYDAGYDEGYDNGYHDLEGYQEGKDVVIKSVEDDDDDDVNFDGE